MTHARSALLIISLLLPLAAAGQYASDIYHSREAVKKLRIDSCSIFTVDEEDGTTTLKEIFIYDTAGNYTKILDHQSGTRREFTWSASGKMTGEQFIPVGTQYETKDTLIYNDAGLIKTILSADRDGSWTTRKYFYGADNTLTKEQFIENDPSGLSSVRFEYIYTDSITSTGKLTWSKQYYHGNLNQTEIFEYNTDNILTAYRVLDTNNNVSVRHEYVVDAKGLRTDLRSFGSDGKLSQVYKSTYDDNGLLKKERWFTDIKDGDLADSEQTTLVYRYSYRK